MKSTLHSLATALRCGAAASALLISGTAWAQSDETPAENVPQDDELVVTGTLIRGIAPVGSNVLDVGEQEIEASGAKTTSQLLATIPQLGNYFNGMPVGVSGVATASASNPIGRPNLRNLPAANTSGGAQTLVLLDGHRVVPMGTQQLAVDPDIIAPGVIERVEAMTDGGSAVYGSDALGGVLNFITRRRFDGVKVTAHYAFADDYWAADGSILAGKDWGSGGIYVAYGYAKSDDVFGIDRDWVKRINWTTGVPNSRNCASPNITVAGTSYVVSGAGIAAGGPNVCDASDAQAILPRIELHNFFAKMSQDLSDNLTFDVTAYYANRRTLGTIGTFGQIGSTLATVNVPSTNPFYRSTGGATATATQSVSFNYAPVSGDRGSTAFTEVDTWNVTPSLALDLGSRWQARALFEYGRSAVNYRNKVVSAAAQTAALNNGTLNPYDVAASSPAALAVILGGLEQGYGRNEFFDYRLIVDGPLFALPADDVRVALGAEYMRDNFKRRASNAQLVLQLPVSYTQTVKSLFGEVQIPLFGSRNATTLLQELRFSASARYDKYNDFGDTFNPKFGVTWKPIDWVQINGSWGKSFNAPTAPDQLGPRTASASLVPSGFLQAPAAVPGVCGAAPLPSCAVPGQTGVFLGNGAVNGLEPQRAKSWSVGLELTPPVLEGLRLSASYYDIKLNGTIGRPVTSQNLAPFYATFPDLWIYQPTGQQVAAVIANSLQNPANVGFTLLNPTSTSQALVSSGGGAPTPVLVVLDTLTRNLGRHHLTGLDFAVSYSHDTGFGSVDASFAGNYRIKQESKLSQTAAVVDELRFDTSRLLFAATLGVNIGNFRAQGTWNHTSGYDRSDGNTAAAFGQTSIGAFNLFNLFFKYDFEGDGLTKDLSLTLNVNNVLDTNPPVYKLEGQAGYDPSRALSIGRIIQFGVSKQF